MHLLNVKASKTGKKLFKGYFFCIDLPYIYRFFLAKSECII
jgi:hypothetical protein